MNLTQLPSWQALSEKFGTFHHARMQDLFALDQDRFKKFSIQTSDLFLDYSKNRIDQETLNLLLRLADECKLETMIEALFNGEKINFTEQRAALHTALRNASNTPVMFENRDIMPTIKNVLDRVETFSNTVRNGKWRGHSGKPIRHIINIGIGGSDLGPKLLAEALCQHHHPDLSCSFVSGVDIKPRLENLDPETCLFVVVSKSFHTKETLANAERAKTWLLDVFGDKKAIAQHFVAVSANTEAAVAFGIERENVFEFWDWVGGRYSLWSAVSLSTILLIGMENFRELLAGAWRMDEHFRHTAFDKNMPVILALLGIWYGNFFGAQSHAIIPYDDRLSGLPRHLQQLDMESNGKTMTRYAEAVNYTTGPVIFGSPGTDCQHAYFQSIHQGSHLIPIDFIAPLNNPLTTKDQHETLLANCFAQSEAMMRGRTEEETRAMLKAAGQTAGEIELLTPHKIMVGNKPSNTLLFDEVSPQSLGALLALYEHKVFVQGIIWGINSFDQWGVELGKELAEQIIRDLHREAPGRHDGSTEGLMAKLRSGRL